MGFMMVHCPKLYGLTVPTVLQTETMQKTTRTRRFTCFTRGVACALTSGSKTHFMNGETYAAFVKQRKALIGLAMFAMNHEIFCLVFRGGRKWKATLFLASPRASNTRSRYAREGGVSPRRRPGVVPEFPNRRSLLVDLFGYLARRNLLAWYPVSHRS